MPAKPAYLKNANEIIAKVEASRAFAFDCAAIAELFGITERHALTLLRVIGGEKIGGAYIISRERLLDHLAGRSVNTSREDDTERLQRLSERFIKLENKQPEIRAVRPAAARSDHQLPQGFRVAGAGRAEIQFNPRVDSAGSFLGMIDAILDFADKYPTEFEDHLKFHNERGEEDE